MDISKKIRLLTIICITLLSMVFSLSSCNDSDDPLAKSGKPVVDDKVTEVTALSGIIVPWTLDEVIEKADVIVSGTVIDILPSGEGPLTKDPDRLYLYTDVLIKVESCFKGETASDTIAVRTPGGRIGDKVMISEYDFRFTAGEQVVLYLVKFSTGTPPEGMNMDSVYKLGSTHGKAVIQGDRVINTDEDATVLSIQELTEKIEALQTVQE